MNLIRITLAIMLLLSIFFLVDTYVLKDKGQQGTVLVPDPENSSTSIQK